MSMINLSMLDVARIEAVERQREGDRQRLVRLARRIRRAA